MNNIGTQEIVTERLILRQFTVDDAKDMYENWAKDSEVTKYLRWPPHTNVDVSRGLLRQWAASYTGLSYYSWAIVLRENNMAIGSIGIMAVGETDESGEIGYCMGKNWWGKGFMTEALKAILRFSFEEVGFNRLEASHSVNNPASGRVMQKAGMKFEGIARQKYKANLGFQDCKIYSILKQEYRR
ncbi:MAG: GCN5-related N-acetyltransferase [Caproiciproducens sp.]|nr:GCN5-related N-acetyltransferase [Caproiciproducens sp.]